MLRQRPRSVPEPVLGVPTCYRCRLPLPADGRAVQAWSIANDAEPALFHLECAPPADGVRWRDHRELPVRAVRDGAE